jgi:excisionase family DNA binding protein
MAEIATPAKRLISVQQAAKLAAVSPATIYRLVQRAEIPAFRVGNGSGPIRLPRDEFTRWLYDETRPHDQPG